MTVKLIVTNKSFKAISDNLISNYPKAIILTEDNILEEHGPAERYIVEYTLIHCRTYMKKTNILIAGMVRHWRTMGWSFYIVVHSQEEVTISRGISGIDSRIRPYVEKAVRMV